VPDRCSGKTKKKDRTDQVDQSDQQNQSNPAYRSYASYPSDGFLGGLLPRLAVLEHVDGGEFAVGFVIIEAIADDELVVDGEAGIVRRKLDLAARSLTLLGNAA
jgi:hypothetical protein